MVRVIVCIFLFTNLVGNSPAFADDFFWVGGTGKWSDFKNHWMTASGGNVTAGRVPSFNDNVFFDQNSFTAPGQVVEIDIINVLVRDFDWSKVDKESKIKLIEGGKNITIYGSLRFNALVTSELNVIYFESSQGDFTIDTRGKSIAGVIEINDNGRFRLITGNQPVAQTLKVSNEAEISLDDSLKLVNLDIYSSSLITNGQSLVVSAVNIYGASVINLATSVVTTVTWNADQNTKLERGTSLINVSNYFSGGDLHYHQVNLCGRVTVYGNNTFDLLTICAGADILLGRGSNQTTIELSAQGTAERPINIKSMIRENPAFITQNDGKVQANYLIMEDNHALGNADFIANNSIALKNVQGWQVNPPPQRNFYWVGGGGNWSDFKNHWATQSGGNTFHQGLPTAFDNVIFDEKSFTTPGQEVNVDLFHAYCHDMTWSNVVENSIIRSVNNQMHIHGSLVFDENANPLINSMQFESEEAEVIRSGGNLVASLISINQKGSFTLTTSNEPLAGTIQVIKAASVQLNDDLITNQNININQGTFQSQSHGIRTQNFSAGNFANQALINITGSTVEVGNWYANNIDLKSDQSIIRLSRQFYGGNLVYHIVEACGKVEIYGNNQYYELKLCAGSDVKFDGNSKSEFEIFTAEGTAGSPINISSRGGTFYLNKVNGEVNANYLVISDNTAGGGAVFNALNSIDLGNVNGWNISPPTARDFYWVGGSGAWSEYQQHWATTSGGDTFHQGIPSAFDNVIFDENSLSGDNDKVTIDVLQAYCNDLDLAKIERELELTISNTANQFNVFGSVFLNQLVRSRLYEIRLMAEQSQQELNTNGAWLANVVYFLKDAEFKVFTGNKSPAHTFSINGNGTLSLNDTLKLSGGISLYSGNVITNGQVLDMFRFEGYGYSGNSKVKLFNSQVFVGYWNMNSQIDLDAGTSTIYIMPKADVGFFSSQNQQYYNVNLNCTVNISGNNQYQTLALTYGARVRISGTQQVEKFLSTGTSSNPIRITGGTINQFADSVKAEYTILENSTAGGGAYFSALRSFDEGNNIGWKIFPPNTNVDANELNVLTGDPICGIGSFTTLSVPSEFLSTYRWFKDEQLLAFDSSSIVVDQPGIYYVELTNPCGTVATSNRLEIKIEEPPLKPEVFTTDPLSYCQAQDIAVELNVKNQANVRFVWYNEGQQVFKVDPIQDQDQDTVFTARKTGAYYVVAEKGVCQVPSDSVFIANDKVIPDPQTIDVHGNSTICNGDSILLSVPENNYLDYEWMLNSIILPSEEVSLWAKEGGDYQVVLVNGCGERLSDAVAVEVKDKPALQAIILNQDPVICKGDSLAVKVNPVPDVSYNWLYNGVVTATAPETYLKEAGMHRLEASNSCGTVISDSLELIQLDVPEDPLLVNLPREEWCEGDLVLLEIENQDEYQEGIFQFSWYQENQELLTSAQPEYEAMTSGNYQVIVSNSCGTTKGNQLVKINFLKIPDTPKISETFRRCGQGELLVDLSGYGNDFNWFDAQENMISSNSATQTFFLQEDMLVYIAANNKICQGELQPISLVTDPVPQAEAGEDRSILLGESTRLGNPNQSLSNQYQWFPADGVREPGSPNPLVIPQESTSYQLTVSNSYGCINTDEVFVEVRKELKFRNAFSPNGDGVNDFWEIANINFYPDARIMIFDRWGKLIFENAGYQQPWDGTYRGEKLPVDTYFYSIDLNDGSEVFRGPVTILK